MIFGSPYQAHQSRAHSGLLVSIAETGIRAGCYAAVYEFGRNDVILLTRIGQIQFTTAVEAEFSWKHSVQNAKRAQAAGANQILFVCPDRRVAEGVGRAINGDFGGRSPDYIHVIVQADLNPAWLHGFVMDGVARMGGSAKRNTNNKDSGKEVTT